MPCDEDAAASFFFSGGGAIGDRLRELGLGRGGTTRTAGGHGGCFSSNALNVILTRDLALQFGHSAMQLVVELIAAASVGSAAARKELSAELKCLRMMMMMLSVMLLIMHGGMTETMRTMMITSTIDRWGGMIEHMRNTQY